MFRNYIKTAWRSLERDRTYTFINIAGLSVGLVVFIVILLFVNKERSYDRWDKGLQHVYRVGVSEEKGGEIEMNSSVPYPIGSFLSENFPEVEAITRAKVDYFESIITPENQSPFYFEKVINADSNFFSVFPYFFVRGDKSALDHPNTAVITVQAAQRIFGDDDPIGKTFQVNRGKYYTVTGVIEKPGPSHLDFEMCLAYHSKYFADNWFMKNFDTYVRLRDDVSINLLSDKAGKVYAEHYARSYKQFDGESKDENEKNVVDWLAREQGIKNPSVFFERIQDIHLKPKGGTDYSDGLPVYDFSKSNQLPIKVFAVVALLVLLLACINYINMSIAQHIKRAKESGIRKVLGASKTQLIFQFVTEAFIICLVSLVISVGLIILAHNWLNNQFQTNIQLWNKFYSQQNILLGVQLCVILIITSLLTGIYPAYILSAYRPVNVLKGEIGSSGKSRWLQHTLIIVQYGIASAFIICIIVISAQMNYMKKSDPGFNADQVMRIQVMNTYLFPGQTGDKSAYIKESLSKIPGVSEISSGYNYPGMVYRNSQVAEGKGGQTLEVNFSLVDYDYFKILGIQVHEGRVFSPAYGKDTIDAAVVNQTFVNRFGWKKAIGKKFNLLNQEYHIIGVVNDSKMEGYKESVSPQVFMMGVDNIKNFSGHDQLFVKINSPNINQTSSSVLNFWKKTEPGFPVRYTWLDEDFNKLFSRYEKFRKIVFGLTLVSLLIAGMGIFALSNYTVRTRTKEIGIRKVMGASIAEIVHILSRKYLLLALISFVVAMPIAWLAMTKWLESFAYRINIGWQMFVLAGLITAIITLASISFQSIKAAMANPVNSLRDE